TRSPRRSSRTPCRTTCAAWSTASPPTPREPRSSSGGWTPTRCGPWSWTRARRRTSGSTGTRCSRRPTAGPWRRGSRRARTATPATPSWRWGAGRSTSVRSPRRSTCGTARRTPPTHPTTAGPSRRASPAPASTRFPGSAARSCGRTPPASCGPPCNGPADPRGCSADPHVRDHREVVGGVEPADPVRVDLGESAAGRVPRLRAGYAPARVRYRSVLRRRQRLAAAAELLGHHVRHPHREPQHGRLLLAVLGEVRPGAHQQPAGRLSGPLAGARALGHEVDAAVVRLEAGEPAEPAPDGP